MLLRTGFFRQHRNLGCQAHQTQDNVIMRCVVRFGNRRAVGLEIHPERFRAVQLQNAPAGFPGQFGDRLNQAGQVRPRVHLHGRPISP